MAALISKYSYPIILIYPLIINNTGKCPICQREIIHIINEQRMETHLNIQREINYCKMVCIVFMIVIIIFYIIKYKI
jgi:hypothetical protein